MRGNHNLATRCPLALSRRRGQDGGDQIGEAFSRSSPRFDDQVFPGSDGVFDCGGHFQLLRSRFVGPQSPRNMATVTEHLPTIERHRKAFLGYETHRTAVTQMSSRCADDPQNAPTESISPATMASASAVTDSTADCRRCLPYISSLEFIASVIPSV